MGAIKNRLSDLPGAAGESLRHLTRGMTEAQEARARVLSLPAGATLLRAQDEATHVYLLLRGSVAAQNELERGGVYAFAQFTAPALFGECEAFADSPVYRGTLVCQEDCLLAALPRADFLDWMRRDSAALFARTQAITAHLVAQAGAERGHLFRSGAERVAGYLCRAWTRAAEDGLLTLGVGRQQLADETGLSVKTVQRAIGRLRDDGLVTTRGHTLLVDPTQYKGLAELV